MDVDMPVLDGVEATRQIVAQLGIPVVVLSGSSSTEGVGDALAAGAVATVVKGQAVHVLAPLLVALAQRAVGEGESGRRDSNSRPPPPKGGALPG
jgi:CheY-like chemotaxis protein